MSELGASAVAREDVEALAAELREGDELAYDNIHADWARESIARTVLSSSWLAAHDEGVRAAERERLAADVQKWVCDGCMATVTRSQIADMVDGEHVLCRKCLTR